MSASDIVGCALDLAALGYSVFPVPVGLAPDQVGASTMRPTRDEAEIEAWPLNGREFNLAVATGLDVVVLRATADATGRGGLVALPGLGDTLPPTVTAIAADGTTEYHFALPGNCDRPAGVAQLAPGITLLGLGAHVFVPPSAGDDGSECRWLRGRGPDEIDLALLPPHLLEAANRAERLPVAVDSPLVDSRAEQVAGASVALDAGQVLVHFAGVLRHLGLSRPAIEAALMVENGRLLEARLDDDEVRRIARSTGATSGHAQALPSLAAKREIEVGNRQAIDIIRDAWAAVLAENDPPTLFEHGESFVQVRVRGAAPVVEAVDTDMANALLLRRARWIRTNSEGDVSEATPPERIATDMVTAPSDSLPHLEAVVTFPIFTPDHGLIANPGYHESSGLWLHLGAGLRLPTVPPAPSSGEQAAALSLVLDDLLVDFPFVTAADRAHAIGAMLLPLVRAFISGPTPLHLLEAPNAGTGKSLLAQLLISVITGQPAPVLTLSKSPDENRKRITSALIGGPAAILFDNVREGIDSAELSAALTSTIWSDRILGGSKLAYLPNRALWVATANNPKLTKEVARRCARIRIDARTDRPWQGRRFKHPEIGQWAQEARGDLLYALLVMVSAWCAAGRPAGKERLGSYEPWSKVIGGILEVAGVEGFLANTEELYTQADPEAAEWQGLGEVWFERHGETPIRTSEVLALATANGLLADVLGDGNEKSQTSKLGRALNARRDGHLKGYVLEIGRDAKSHAATYRLRPTRAEVTRETPSAGLQNQVPPEVPPEKSLKFQRRTGLAGLSGLLPQLELGNSFLLEDRLEQASHGAEREPSPASPASPAEPLQVVAPQRVPTAGLRAGLRDEVPPQVPPVLVPRDREEGEI